MAVEDPSEGGVPRYVIPERKGKVGGGGKSKRGRVRSGGRIKSTRFSGLEIKRVKGRALGRRGEGRGSS